MNKYSISICQQPAHNNVRYNRNPTSVREITFVKLQDVSDKLPRLKRNFSTIQQQEVRQRSFERATDTYNGLRKAKAASQSVSVLLKESSKKGVNLLSSSTVANSK